MHSNKYIKQHLSYFTSSAETCLTSSGKTAFVMRLNRSLLSLANGEAYVREVAFQCSSYAALIQQLKDRGDVFAYSSQPSVVLLNQVVLVLGKRGKICASTWVQCDSHQYSRNLHLLETLVCKLVEKMAHTGSCSQPSCKDSTYIE